MDSRDDDDDLPDVDYRSIYGQEALQARDLRRLRATHHMLDALEHKMDATTARLTAMTASRMPAPRQTARQALLAFVAQLSDADAEALWKLFCSWYPPKTAP